MTGNVVGIVNTFGLVQERYAYDPQGNVTFLDAGFTPRSPQVSSFQWEHLYASLARDPSGGSKGTSILRRLV